jgi:DNA-binding PadR family transcriptional regulator
MMVYAALQRMTAEGLLVGELTISGGRRHRLYGLTEAGYRLLQAMDTHRVPMRPVGRSHLGECRYA